MTNRQAIEAKIGLNYPIDSVTFEYALMGLDIDPEAWFVPGKAFDMALVSLIDTLIGSAERITESGFTVQMNLDALYRLRSLLVRKWGDPDLSGAILRDRSRMW